jgi:hypothetical protein
MKRKFSVLMLCSLLLIITVGIVRAGNPNYTCMEYGCIGETTIDGHWSEPLEWYDGPVLEMGDGALCVYNLDFNTYGMQWCIEFFTDNTADAEDYWQICIDDSNTGGSAPQSDDYRIDIVGHANLIFYQGNGASWDAITPDSGEITWANMLDGSPRNTTAHWILELAIVKTIRVATNAPPTGMRVACYDASTETLAAWAPGSDRDDPDTWGLIDGYSQDPIPEGLNLAVMVFLSSVSLVVGSHYLQKRSKKQEIV